MSLTAPDLRRVAIEKVQPWKDNPRTIKRADYDRLKRQVLELGFYKPLVATSDGNGGWIVVGGNMRLRVLRDLKVTNVDISVVDAPTDEARLKYALSDNDRAGAWDDQALAELAYKAKDTVGSFDIFKLDLAAPVQFGRLLGSFGPAQDPTEDQVPSPEPEAVTRPGDAFTLGRHRVLCGDAGDPANYVRLLQNAKADMVFTATPARNALGEEAALEALEALVNQVQQHLKKGGAFYVCTEYGALPGLFYAIKKAGMTLAGVIAWILGGARQSRSDYPPRHDVVLKGTNQARRGQPVVYGWNGGRHYFFPTQPEADVWEARSAGPTKLDQARKPLALVQRAIKNSSRPDEIVLDPHAGAGSTLVAAEREGRTARLLEAVREAVRDLGGLEVLAGSRPWVFDYTRVNPLAGYAKAARGRG